MWQLSGCCCESQHFVRCFCLPWLLLLLLPLCQVAALVANNISGHTFCFFLSFAFSSCLPYLNVIYVCRFTLLFLLFVVVSAVVVMCDVEFPAGLLCIKFVIALNSFVCVKCNSLCVPGGRLYALFLDASFCCACACSCELCLVIIFVAYF